MCRGARRCGGLLGIALLHCLQVKCGIALFSFLWFHFAMACCACIMFRVVVVFGCECVVAF